VLMVSNLARDETKRAHRDDASHSSCSCHCSSLSIKVIHLSPTKLWEDKNVNGYRLNVLVTTDGSKGDNSENNALMILKATLITSDGPPNSPRAVIGIFAISRTSCIVLSAAYMISYESIVNGVEILRQHPVVPREEPRPVNAGTIRLRAWA